MKIMYLYFKMVVQKVKESGQLCEMKRGEGRFKFNVLSNEAL